MIHFTKMNDHELSQLLHENSMENIRRGLDEKTAWYSIGFIIGSKLRQVLRAKDPSEIEAYISHLRNVSAPREYDGGRLV